MTAGKYEKRSDRPIYIDFRRFPASLEGAPPETTSVVLDLIGAFVPEGNGAFQFDPAACADVLRSRLPDDAPRRLELTAALLTKLRPFLLRFFIELPDGRCALNPDMFSATSST